MSRNGLHEVPVEQSPGGALSDHYDPRKKALFLSEPVYTPPSVAAAAVAAHETGHALQDSAGYAPLKIRSAMYPAVAFASSAWIWLLILGAVLNALNLVAFAVTTFAYFLPQIADYRDVWGVLKGLSWPWAFVLAAATILNLITFAPPWQVVLPGLPFRRAFVLTQVATALAMVVPAGAAVGIAGAYGILRRWGYPGREIGRGVTLVSLWNQFANLSYPAIAVVLLAAFGADSPVLATAGFVGAAVLVVAVGALVAMLSSGRTATWIGDRTAATVDWIRAKIGREPVLWGGVSFERFRGDTVYLLRRRWHALTLATYGGTLTVFLVLLIALRALDVPGSEVTAVEAFAPWSLAR